MNSPLDGAAVRSIKLDDERAQALSVSANEQVALEIDGAGTTGYLWELAQKSPNLEVLEHKIEPNLQAFGAAGFDRFVVRAMQPGTVRIVFSLRAPWEARAIKQFEVRLEVKNST